MTATVSGPKQPGSYAVVEGLAGLVISGTVVWRLLSGVRQDVAQYLMAYTSDWRERGSLAVNESRGERVQRHRAVDCQIYLRNTGSFAEAHVLGPFNIRTIPGCSASAVSTAYWSTFMYIVHRTVSAGRWQGCRDRRRATPTTQIMSPLVTVMSRSLQRHVRENQASCLIDPLRLSLPA